MQDLQTGKKESPAPDGSYNNTTTVTCQEETLVVRNAIFENMNHFLVYDHCISFIPRRQEPFFREKERKPRGKISGFSNRSRFRLFTLLAMIRNDLAEPPLFVTLTYHHGHQNTEKSTKSQLHNFLVQLRNFDPNVQFIWRIELQKRGAPHYHLIIFPGDNQHYQNKTFYEITISKIWHNLADPKSRKHKEYGCDVKKIKSYREACSYMSKYIAKASIENLEDVEGKHWGNSRNLPVKMRKRIGNFDEESVILIKKLLVWMKENGKAKFADEQYLNIHNDFIVFIDREEFLKICNDEFFFERDY